jgi:hypothetical protein
MVGRSFKIGIRASKIIVPEGAIAVAARASSPGWIVVDFDNYQDDMPLVSRSFRAVHAWDYPKRDSYRSIAKVGALDVIEILPRLKPVNISSLDIQRSPLDLGLTILKLPAVSAVNLKRPLRTWMGKPHLCWRGDMRKSKRVLLSYLIACASRRSEKYTQHVADAQALVARGVLSAIESHDLVYDLWVDTKFLGGIK